VSEHYDFDDLPRNPVHCYFLTVFDEPAWEEPGWPLPKILEWRFEQEEELVYAYPMMEDVMTDIIDRFAEDHDRLDRAWRLTGANLLLRGYYETNDRLMELCARREVVGRLWRQALDSGARPGRGLPRRVRRTGEGGLWDLYQPPRVVRLLFMHALGDVRPSPDLGTYGQLAGRWARSRTEDEVRLAASFLDDVLLADVPVEHLAQLIDLTWGCRSYFVGFTERAWLETVVTALKAGRTGPDHPG